MRITWDKVGEHRFETGVDHGVLYPIGATGQYDLGVPWNGLTTVTESPSGAESNKQYADNIEYLNLKSAEQFGATVEAFTYPPEFAECDGTAVFGKGGVTVGQQTRKTFGLAYRTKVGNDLDPDAGYKIHLVYGASANPAEKAYTTVNDSPEALNFSWELSTTAVAVGTIDGKEVKPTAIMTVDSTIEDPANMAALEDLLYGTAGGDPRLPLPAEVIAIFAGGAVVEVETVPPSYDPATDTVTIPSVTGVDYYIGGEPVSGSVTITEDTVVTARPASGYSFTDTSDTDWTINYS